jgi:hypothetical protein
MNKYEKLIEYIVNDEQEQARALFHDIVVEKSRSIYESMMDDDHHHLGGDKVEDLVDEVSADEEGMSEDDEIMSMDSDEMGHDEMDHDEMGHDEMDHDEMGHDEMGKEDDIEDRVMDLEDALDELKSEFDRLMGDEEHEPEHHDGEDDPEFSGDMDSGDEDDDMMEGKECPTCKKSSCECDDEDDEEMSESRLNRRMTAAEKLREYVDKVGEVYSQEPAKGEGKTVGKGGDNPTVNSKSIVAGKNDMGGTTANIVKGGSESNPDNKSVPQPSNEYSKKKGELKGAGSFKNVPGGNAGKTAYKDQASRQPIKKDSESGKEVGNNGSVSINKKSEIGGKVR